MRHVSRSVVACASLALAVGLTTSSLHAANLLQNPGFELPPGGTIDSNVVGWTLFEDTQRENFANHTPGGNRSIWQKTFEPVGGHVDQTVGITGGASYLFSAYEYFETLYPTTEASIFLKVSWLDASNAAVGTPNVTTILPTDVTTTNAWTLYSTNVLAPATATQATISLGWEGGGPVGNGQSAFVDDVVFDGPGTPPPPVTSDWVPNASGDWNVNTNWANGTVPNAIGAPANFLGAIAAAHTVYSDVPVVAGALKFNNANTYVISGAGTLTLDVASGNATIDVLNGSHKINLPLRLNDNTVATVASGTTLTIADPLTLANGSTLTKAGAGTLEIISTVSAVSPASLLVQGGSANLRTDLGTGITLHTAGGTTTAFAAQHLAAVQVDAGSTLKIDSTGTARAIKTNALTIASGGKIDIGDNGLIVQYSGSSPLEALRTAIIAAYNGGAFNGNGIGTSAPVAGRGIGYANSNQIGSPTSFLGESFTGTAALLRYTLSGDANLDGTVAFADLLSLAKSYGQTNQRWINGDSDYNGTVDFTDLLALAKNYGGTLAPADAAALTQVGGEAFASDLALAQSLVPEPASLTLIGLGGAALLRRRRAR